MDADKVNSWLSLVANMGVLLGLGVVVYELNHSRHLLRAELGADTAVISRDLHLAAATDDSLSLALSKAITAPETLTEHDIVILDAYLKASIRYLTREHYLIRVGVFQDDPGPLIKEWVDEYMTSNFALAWWAENRGYYQSVAPMIDEEVIQISPDGESNYVEKISSRLRSTPEKK